MEGYEDVISSSVVTETGERLDEIERIRAMMKNNLISQEDGKRLIDDINNELFNFLTIRTSIEKKEEEKIEPEEDSRNITFVPENIVEELLYEDVSLKMNESQYQLILSMVKKQERECLSQFATIVGKYTGDTLEVESLDIWPEESLNQTKEASVPRIAGWEEWMMYNAISQDGNFIATIHTHPLELGVGHNDEADIEFFKNCTTKFAEKDIISINGVASEDGIIFKRYNPETRSFSNIKCFAGNEVISNKNV